MVRLLGLTGPIACGKSSVSQLLAESGEAPVTSFTSFTSLPGLHSEKTLTGSIHVNSVNSLSSSLFFAGVTRLASGGCGPNRTSDSGGSHRPGGVIALTSRA